MSLLQPEMLELLLRLLVAVVLGASLGVERSLAGKTAGMRTYALVSLGAAMFVAISQAVTSQYMQIGMRNFDPLRVASQIVVGIGFLGAGLIIFKSHKLRGLTTAAGLWVAAGIGMASGYGLYFLAIGGALFTLLIFTVLWQLEQVLERHVLPEEPKERKTRAKK
ncbi:MAG: MgtC/SapB family protein [Candidatus Vogelbacteria bacterium]|nr:MgtC/SapB family protein [Candidatus Vogelbacteria bacterium]